MWMVEYNINAACEDDALLMGDKFHNNEHACSVATTRVIDIESSETAVALPSIAPDGNLVEPSHNVEYVATETFNNEFHANKFSKSIGRHRWVKTTPIAVNDGNRDHLKYVVAYLTKD